MCCHLELKHSNLELVVFLHKLQEVYYTVVLDGEAHSIGSCSFRLSSSGCNAALHFSQSFKLNTLELSTRRIFSESRFTAARKVKKKIRKGFKLVTVTLVALGVLPLSQPTQLKTALPFPPTPVYRVAQGVGCHSGACVDGGPGVTALRWQPPSVPRWPTIQPVVGEQSVTRHAWTLKLFKTAARVRPLRLSASLLLGRPS